MTLFDRLVLPITFLLAVAAIAVAAPALTAPAMAATSQRWSEPATWGGDVPDAGDTVTIPAGKTVVLDVSPPKLAGLEVDGTMRFANRPLTLRTGWIMVHGRLQIGTEAAPHTAPAEIVLDGNPDANTMGMGSNVLGVMGGELDLHGVHRPVSWTRLQRIASLGSRTLRVGSAKGWRAGDRIVVASTDLDPSRAEERVISAVNGDVVTVDEPLTYTHWGQSDEIAGETIAQRAEVGLLTRNIVVRGPAAAADTGIGGHIMVHSGSLARVSDVELVNMGQAGRLARYPFHFHMMGSASDSYIRSSAIHHSFNRCVTVHGTQDVTVEDNVGYHTRGHCFFFEDGVETGVRLVHNLGLSTLRPAADQRILSTDSVPATFWIQHPRNTVRGNAAAGSDGNGFWYDLPDKPTGLSSYSSIRPRTAPMGVFSGNVAHSNINRSNQFRSGTGLLVEDYRPEARALFKGLAAWKNSGFGVWADHNVAVAGATLSDNAVGFLGRDAAIRNSVFVGATSNAGQKHWSTTGLGMYHDTFTASGVTFANFKPEEWRHGVAIGSIVEHINALPKISDARFVNADRVRLTPPWVDDVVPASGFRDLDGSVSGTGKPSTIVSANPLLRHDECVRAAAVDGYLCPPGGEVAYVLLQDESGNNAPLGPTTVNRDDGLSALATSDPGFANGPQSETSVALGHRYRFDLGRQTPSELEWVVAGEQTGWVQLAVPWPHDSLYVYEGWGEWADTLDAASSQSGLDGGHYWLDPDTNRVHVRFSNSGSWTWQRIKVCTQRYCGEGLGTRTS